MVYHVARRVVVVTMGFAGHFPINKDLPHKPCQLAWVYMFLHAECLQCYRIFVEEVVGEVGQSHAGIDFVRL